jgi:hypothetical protein
MSDVDLFRYRQGIVHFDAEISDRAFDLGVAKQKLNCPEIASASVDQSSLSSSERMSSEKPRVQSYAANPFRNKTRVLSRCHTALRTIATCKQELAGPFVGSL